MKLRDLIGSGAPITVTDEEELARARRRVARMSVNELLDWADAAGSGMAKGFSDYRKEGEMVSLEDIRVGLIALTALTDELIGRHEAEHQ